MDFSKPDDKESLRRRLRELEQRYAQQQQPQQPAGGASFQTKSSFPTASPPPELPDLSYRFLRAYISPGEAVSVTAHRRGLGPWEQTPVFQYSFQSSKPSVRVTVTPRQGQAVEYVFTGQQSGGISGSRSPTNKIHLRVIKAAGFEGRVGRQNHKRPQEDT
ncbi:hypothetical protein Esti_006311 [Eimeria stiedai]